MRAKVAVATVQGKAYYFIVNILRQRNIPFLSLMPGETVPSQVKVVITTQDEKPLVNHDKILVYDLYLEPAMLAGEIVKSLQGKDSYETVHVGLDPGEVIGMAVLADGVVIQTENCYSLEETLYNIETILKAVGVKKSAVTVKIGSGVPSYKTLLEALDKGLPPEVAIEIVGEAGTNGRAHGVKRGRKLRHMVSAVRIAEREGHIHSRRNNALEYYSSERQDIVS